MEQQNLIATAFLDIAFKVHRTLGPGLLESCYEEVLCYELAKSGIAFGRQVEVPLVYEGTSVGAASPQEADPHLSPVGGHPPRLVGQFQLCAFEGWNHAHRELIPLSPMAAQRTEWILNLNKKSAVSAVPP